MSADELWALAEHWLNEASDPGATAEQAQFARQRYAEAVRAAQAADETEGGESL